MPWENFKRFMGISIHALREEGDERRCCHDHFERRISIHALREEGDSKMHKKPQSLAQFLSTPSARRATYQPHT